LIWSNNRPSSWCGHAKKHEPASDVDAAVADSLKALDLNLPIREADINTVRKAVWVSPRSRAAYASGPRVAGMVINMAAMFADRSLASPRACLLPIK
jgi:hypothetical protein